MKLNVTAQAKPVFTHEGAPAFLHLTPLQALRRSVLSCLLWENEFYEDGQSIAARIEKLAEEVKVTELAALAIEAREKYNLRHVPLLLLCALAKRGVKSSIVSETIFQTIQRADELTELCAIYWRNGKVPLSAQMKKGLARAFGKFNAYQLAKYNRDGQVKLRDVLRLVHAKPNAEQEEVWKKLMNGTLESPDTWEVALSGGANKKETFTRLLLEKKLGYLALLRNLRNMQESGVDANLIRGAILERRGADKVLPFRFTAAARIVPMFEPELDAALLTGIMQMETLQGRTAILVDVSGSMNERLSAKSDLTRRDAAATLASIFPGNCRVFAFADVITEVPPRKGMAGVDAINNCPRGGTRLFDAIEEINKKVPYDRIVVITDEQTTGFKRQHFEQSALQTCPAPKGKGYIINVASAQNGVGYGPWVHIDGFSEQVINFILEHERQV
jgi:hypothetical protein